MPTFEMTDALKEALASVRTDVVEYYTFEFTHPDWTDPARIVSGFEQINAKLEADSESGHGGELVTFFPVPIEFTLPPTVPGEVPTFEFKYYDMSGIMRERIFQTDAPQKRVKMYMRVFLSNHLEDGPETIPVPSYHVLYTKLEPYSGLITGRCVFQDYMGRSAPFRTYTLAEFPGLRRR